MHGMISDSAGFFGRFFSNERITLTTEEAKDPKVRWLQLVPAVTVGFAGRTQLLAMAPTFFFSLFFFFPASLAPIGRLTCVSVLPMLGACSTVP